MTTAETIDPKDWVSPARQARVDRGPCVTCGQPEYIFEHGPFPSDGGHRFKPAGDDPERFPWKGMTFQAGAEARAVAYVEPYIPGEMDGIRVRTADGARWNLRRRPDGEWVGFALPQQ